MSHKNLMAVGGGAALVAMMVEASKAQAGAARGAAPGAAPGAADLLGAMGATPSGTGGAPVPGASPDSAGAFDPTSDLFDGGPDPMDAMAALGGGLPPGADGQSPVMPGPDGQPMVMTGQGALPLVMGDQGPMALTQNGPVPLEALRKPGASAADDFQMKAALAQVAKAAQVVQVASQVLSGAAKKAAMASSSPVPPSPPPAPYSGRSSFVSSSPAPTSRPAIAADTFQAPAVKEKSAPHTDRPVADPKLNEKAGVGTRIGTTGTGDGNLN